MTLTEDRISFRSALESADTVFGGLIAEDAGDALTVEAAADSGSDLIMTAIFDGPLSGGIPKGVELYVRNDIADLSIYGLGSANNGGGTDGQEFTFSGSATAGQFLYVGSESTGFTSFFGFAPDFTSSAVNINGDDAMELFQNGSVVDLFGDINVDGSGEAWDHLDGWAARNIGATPNATFDINDWSFSGTNALDGETSNATAATPVPIGVFTEGPASIDGTNGRDRLDGTADADTINGLDGNDVITGGAGADIIDGGNGEDIARYANSTIAVTVDLSDLAAESGGTAEGDVLTNIENLYGSFHDDTLTGDANRNQLRGFAGDDTLTGNDGNDIFMGGLGADSHDGGNGRDHMRYAVSASGVEVDMNGGPGAGDAAGDTFTSVEIFTGSSFDDVFVGNGEATFFYGGNGADTFSAGAGRDNVFGQGGADTFVLAAGDEFTRVRDFEDDVDSIDLTAFGYVDWADLTSDLFTFGTGVAIFDGTDMMFIDNIAIAALENDVIL